MELIFHTGVPFTDGGRLMKCLLRNKDAFSQRGVSVPGPSTYRDLLAQTLEAFGDSPLPEDAGTILLDSILDDEKAQRVIMSTPRLFGMPNAVVGDGFLLPQAARGAALLQRLFEQEDVHVYMGLCNPARFMSIAFEQSRAPSFSDLVSGIAPQEYSWLDTIDVIREVAPDVKLTLWCHEDTPLLWGEIVRTLAGLESRAKISGGFDMLASVISREGMQSYRAYLKQNPTMTDEHLRQVTGAFLAKYALPEETEDEITIPGWSDSLTAEITEIYDQDIEELSQMEDVRLLLP